VYLGLGGWIAVVRGATRGPGRGTAGVRAVAGAGVWLHGFARVAAEREAAALRDAGGNVSPVWGDVCDDAGAEAVARAVLEEDGRVDVLVNNYGVAAGPGWQDAESADWIRSYEHNVLSGVRLVRALVPGMRGRGFGRVIFVGTVGSLRPGSRTPHYYAAKAALPNLVVGLAKELAGSGVTANVVSPGVIATAEVRDSFLRAAETRGWEEAEGGFEAVEARAVAAFMPNPAARAGRVEEVGALVAFLAGDRAGYINGANLRIDGGAADAAV
jgi:NAD(P)-dependent dehydrogenase (short-subunit alcohol dehydrogenase family)